AVRVGTRFVASEEAGARPAYVDKLSAANAKDTILTEAFSTNWPNAPHRVLRSCVEAVERFQGDVVGETAQPWAPEVRVPVRRGDSFVADRTTTGEIDAMPLWAGDSFGPEGREHAVQVLHAVVDHEGRAILTEVFRLRGEDGPDRGPFGLPVLPTPPREEGHRILDVHPQMTTVPLDQCLRILRLEEDASEARHAGSTLSCRHIPGVVLDEYEGEVERSSSS